MRLSPRQGSRTGVWTYIRSEPGLWTVGHYDGKGKWHPESDHTSSHDAAQRVHWLNGQEGEYDD